MIARVDERTKTMIETMATKADVFTAMTKAENADKKITDHIESHKWNIGTAIAIFAGSGGIAAGLAALLSIPKAHP